MVRNVFRDKYLRLVEEFSAAIVDPGEHFFSLAWTRTWYENLKSVPPRTRRVCFLGPSVPALRPNYPRQYLNSVVYDQVDANPPARERFIQLAEDAGSSLPKQVRDPLKGRYWTIFNQSAVARWCGLLFALAEAEPDGLQTDSDGNGLVVISHPFSASIDAIAACGLTTESPTPPKLRENCQFVRRVVPAIDSDSSDLRYVPSAKPAHQSPSGRVRLYGQREPVEIDGHQVPALTEARYAVVRTLLEAGSGGLSEQQLMDKSKKQGARNMLRVLSKQTYWTDVIVMGGVAGGGYRIL